MNKMGKWLLSGLCAFCLFGCSVNQEIPEEQVLYRLQWEGKEITFYESSILSYTDGEKSYASGYHMLNSQDGTKRLYVIEDAFDSEYKIIQEDVILEPIGTFIVKSFEGETYEKALEIMQKFGIIEEDVTLSNIVAKVYSLDTSKPTRLWFEGMPEAMPRRWEDAGDNMMRGIPVEFTFEELNEIMNSWSEVKVAKNLIDKYSRKRQVSWEGIVSNQLIYENGMEMHVPEIVVSSVMVGDIKYMEVENRLNYSNAFTLYYELTDDQWESFENWKSQLIIIKK